MKKNENLNFNDLKNTIREYIVIQDLAKSLDDVPEDVVEYLSSERYIDTMASKHSSMPWDQKKIDSATAEFKGAIEYISSMSQAKFAKMVENRNYNFYVIVGTIILNCLGWTTTGEEHANPSLALRIQKALPKTTARFFMNSSVFDKDYRNCCIENPDKELPTSIVNALKILVNEYMSETGTSMLKLLVRDRDDIFYDIVGYGLVDQKGEN